MSTWPVTLQTRTDRDGTTVQLTQDGRTVRVRFHRDGTIRFKAAQQGEVWLFDGSGRMVPREHGYPVIRVRTAPRRAQ